jgi:hypothetical protein
MNGTEDHCVNQNKPTSENNVCFLRNVNPDLKIDMNIKGGHLFGC